MQQLASAVGSNAALSEMCVTCGLLEIALRHCRQLHAADIVAQKTAADIMEALLGAAEEFIGEHVHGTANERCACNESMVLGDCDAMDRGCRALQEQAYTSPPRILLWCKPSHSPNWTGEYAYIQTC